MQNTIVGAGMTSLGKGRDGALRGLLGQTASISGTRTPQRGVPTDLEE